MNLTFKLQEFTTQAKFPPMWAHEATQFFKNHYGEQWIASFHDDKLHVSGSDVGWKEMIATPEEVKEYCMYAIKRKKEKHEVSDNPLLKYSMNDGEELWLKSIAVTFLHIACSKGIISHEKMQELYA